MIHLRGVDQIDGHLQSGGDAIQKAGGFGQFARKDNIRVSRRRKDGTIEFFKINLEEIGRKGKTENDMLLKSGDVVYVYESSI